MVKLLNCCGEADQLEINNPTIKQLHNSAISPFNKQLNN